MMNRAMIILTAIYFACAISFLIVSPQLPANPGLAMVAILLVGGILCLLVGVLYGRRELDEVLTTYQNRLTKLTRQNEDATQRFLRQGRDLEQCRQRNVDLDRKILGLHRQLTDSQIPLLTQVDDLARQMVDDDDYLINHRDSRPAKQQRVAGHDDGASIQQASLIQALTTSSSPLRTRVDDSCDNPNRASDSSPSSSYSSSSDSGSSSSCD